MILCFVVEKEKQLSLSTCVLNYVLFSELSVDAAPIAALCGAASAIRCLGGKRDAETRAQHGPWHDRRYFPLLHVRAMNKR